MLTIPQALQKFISSLELTPNQTEDASRCHTYLREQLQKRMRVEDNFLSGSYARNTAVRPLNDIDVFVVLARTPELSPSATPSAVLKVLRQNIEAIYSAKTAELQTRSVHIEFSSGLAFDVVPGFAHEGNYLIPDRGTNQWIRTNPREHQRLSTAANERSNNKLKPLLKAVKRSNYIHRSSSGENPGRSFHLEVMSWSVLKSDSGPYLDGLITLLDGLERRALQACPDPAKLGPNIEPSQARCEKTKAWLGDMLRRVRNAKAVDLNGYTAKAHDDLAYVFGTDWPKQ